MVEVWRDAKVVFSAPLRELHQAWDEVSWRIARLRDDPRRPTPSTRRRVATTTRDCTSISSSPRLAVAPALVGARPKVAVLREQGVNSHVELSYAMDRAGFDTYDVHMTDLQAGRARLDMFQGFVACGGFSYGDTLGAGEGWARSILFNPQLADQFASFFARPDGFALGVCNGCQMLAALAAMIPGAEAWPRFTNNLSQQFEARLSMVEVLPSPSIFFSDLTGSRLPIAVAHGEGFADFSQRGDAARVHRGAALRRQRRPRDRSVSGQPERQPGRLDRRDHRRRSLHRTHAAPRAGVSQRPDELVARVAQRAEPVAADLRKRAPASRLRVCRRVGLEPLRP